MAPTEVLPCRTVVLTGPPALLVAPVVLFTGVATWGATFIYWPLALPFGAATVAVGSTPVTEGVRSSRINKEIRAMFVNNEIPDTRLAPGGHVAGHRNFFYILACVTPFLIF